MIRHLIRQERNGGFWLIRDQGRVLELGNAAYQYLAALYINKGKLSEKEHKVYASKIQLEGDNSVLQHINKEGLLNSDAWFDDRHVPITLPLEKIPKDAVISPKRIYFEVTRSCNLSCRSCFNNSHHPMKNELSLNEILNVNQQAWELGVFEMRYTGGECTILPEFEQIVSDARNKGFYISIGSNGVYTDEQLEWLPDSGIDWFILSLDGEREINDKIRGKGSFDQVIKTLKVLKLHSATRVRLNMVVARHNIKSIEGVARIASENGVDSLNLIPLRPYGRSLNKMVDEMFNQSDFYLFIQEVNRLRQIYRDITFSTTIDLLDPDATTSHDLIVQKKNTCAAGVEACVIGAQGHVYGCSYSPASFPDEANSEGKKLFIAGNLRQDNLGDIWRESDRWAVFRNLQQYKNLKCHSCDHYTIRCSGSCPIMAWHQKEFATDSLNKIKSLGEFCDPYCFVDIYKDSGLKVADSIPAEKKFKDPC